MEEKLKKYIITATDIVWLPVSLFTAMTSCLTIHSYNYLSHYPLLQLIVSSIPTNTCLTIHSYNYPSHYPLLQILVSLFTPTTIHLTIHSYNYLSHYPLPWLLVSLFTPTTTCLTIHSYNYPSHYPHLQLPVSLSTPITTCLTIHSYNYLTQIAATTTCLSSPPSGVNSRPSESHVQCCHFKTEHWKNFKTIYHSPRRNHLQWNTRVK